MDIIEIPDLVNTMICSKQVRNVNKIDIESIFPSTVNISEYQCYCIGYDKYSHNKCVIPVMLLSCEKTPFIGRHLIRVYNDVVYVNSLNSTRTHEWFSDKLSFDRSTFILINNIPIRLSTIRSKIILPTFKGDISVSIKRSPIYNKRSIDEISIFLINTIQQFDNGDIDVRKQILDRVYRIYPTSFDGVIIPLNENTNIDILDVYF